RRSTGHVLTVGWTIILHADWAGDLALEGIEDRRTHSMFIDGAECVEIPIVVVPEASGLVTEARRALRRHASRLVECRMVDTRPRSQQITHCRAFFLGGERRLVVIDAERANRLRKVDLAPFDGNADECTQQALAHRSERRLDGRVAPLCDNRA